MDGPRDVGLLLVFASFAETDTIALADANSDSPNAVTSASESQEIYDPLNATNTNFRMLPAVLS